MSASPIDALPEAYARSVRLAPLPREARTLLRHLGPWTIDVLLPNHPSAMSLSQRQFLKLALIQGEDVLTGSLEVAEVPASVAVAVSRGGDRLLLGPDDLALDLRTLVHRLAVELTDPSDLVSVGEAFALELAREETVRTLSSRMLRAGSLDEALHAMLLGITSGYGARFHRAALFTYDASARSFRGSFAVGPRDDAEAHRIWEAIETEDKTLDQSLDDYDAVAASAFQDFVQTLVLRESEGADARDELALALAAGTPLLFRTPPHSAALCPLLAPAGEFVLAVIQPRGRRLGLLVADNAYGGEPIQPAQIAFLRALVDPTSLVWDTRLLLREVDALARHDPLTGLANRRELEERMRVEQSRCARAGRPLSLAVVDLDHFKQVNDTRGHAVGDEVLRRVGRLLEESLRQHDLPSRYGGDEFVVLLPEATRPELLAAACRIGASAREEGISLSIGGATLPEDAADVDGLFTAADAQLYIAKSSGRSCLSLAGAPPVRF